MEQERSPEASKAAVVGGNPKPGHPPPPLIGLRGGLSLPKGALLSSARRISGRGGNLASPAWCRSWRRRAGAGEAPLQSPSIRPPTDPPMDPPGSGPPSGDSKYCAAESPSELCPGPFSSALLLRGNQGPRRGGKKNKSEIPAWCILSKELCCQTPDGVLVGGRGGVHLCFGGGSVSKGPPLLLG